MFWVKPNVIRLAQSTRAVWKVRGLAAMRLCYAEGDGDLRQVVVVGVT
jgi:hypothetical protein